MSEEWIDVLSGECKRTSQSKVAARLGVSTTVVNQVIKGKYNGNLSRIKKLLEGELMNHMVNCPVLGEIRKNECMHNQGLEFNATNRQRVQLYKACHNGCVNAKLTQ
ncbi:MAG: XRE family transcriptional regulator [Gammaproteobacteria bacterium]|nr:XRE family transcriptional regulator [Gammaproteobacteria bacterium]